MCSDFFFLMAVLFNIHVTYKILNLLLKSERLQNKKKNKSKEIN